MDFTDDDLERLREDIGTCTTIERHDDEMKALVERLEKAEEKCLRLEGELQRVNVSEFQRGKEFAILTIGNAITSKDGSEAPFLAYSIAVEALRAS